MVSVAGGRTETMVVDVAVVTGGAGGLGQLIARELADHGLHVVIADTDQGAALELVAQLQARRNRATFIHTDAAEAAGIEQLMAQVADLGWLRVLVNNAGAGCPARSIPEAPSGGAASISTWPCRCWPPSLPCR